MQQKTETIVCPGCGAINRAPADKLAGGAKPKCGKCHAPMFTGEPIAAGNAAAFDRHISQGSLPVLVDFWAEWCGPCKMMAPMFAKAAQSLEPRLRLMKIDTEALPEVAARYGIRSIPTLIMFKGGREIARQAGAMDTASIERWARQAILG